MGDLPFTVIRHSVRAESPPTKSRYALQFAIRLTVPLKSERAKSRQHGLHFLIAHISGQANQKSEIERQTVFDVAAFRITLPSSIVARIAQLGGDIDSGRLENLASLAALKGGIESVNAAEEEFLKQFGFESSNLFLDRTGHTGIGYGPDSIPGGADEQPDPEDVRDFAFGLQTTGNDIMAAGAVAAVVDPPAGAGAAAVGGAMYLVGRALEKADDIFTAVAEHLGGGAPESLYPDVPGLDPETSAKMLTLLATYLGDHLLSNNRRAVEAGIGVHAGAPYFTRAGFLFGFPKLDAYILALATKAMEAGRGGHHTDPAPQTPGETTVKDPNLLAVDPNWNPYFVNAMLAATGDRHALINSMAKDIKVVLRSS